MPRRPYRHACLVSVCLALVAGPLVASIPADAAGPEWVPPVPGRVVRPFQEPLATYAAGHRGVDFAAASGASVRAANDGVVSFAGTVAGSLHVVVAHDGGIRTSYSFLLRADVRVGQRVQRGQVVGAAGGTGDGHATGVLHFGVRVGERYVDPMLLFQPRDLTQLVRLVPANERDVSAQADPEGDAAALFAWMQESDSNDSSCGAVIGEIASAFDFGDEASSACDAVRDVVDKGLDALRAGGEAGAQLAEEVGPVVHAVIDRMEQLGEDLAEAAKAVAAEAAELVETAVRALAEYGTELYERLTSCPQPDPIANPVGSGNLVMAVAGRDSSRRRRADGSVGASFHFEAKVLGYYRDDVSFFSYEAHSETYEKAATYGDLHEKARLLGEQIKSAARTQPGRHLDLVAHSQGGVVIDLFIMEVYRGHESEYPPIDNVVTFASPHEGTPAARLGVAAADSPFGPTIESGTNQQLDAPNLRELSPDSPTMRGLWSGHRPSRGIRYLSIMGSEDPVVPSSTGDVPGGTKTVVPVGAPYVPDDHSAILTDSDALSAAQAQLSGGAPADTCGALVDVTGSVYSAAVTAAADLVERIPRIGPPPLTMKEQP